MLSSGKAVKVTIYLSDGAKSHGLPVYSGVLDFLFKSGIAGATAVKGIAGFGLRHHLHTANVLELSDRLPIRIEFIDIRDKVEAILPQLESRCGCGLIEIQETTVLVPARQT